MPIFVESSNVVHDTTCVCQKYHRCIPGISSNFLLTWKNSAYWQPPEKKCICVELLRVLFFWSCFIYCFISFFFKRQSLLSVFMSWYDLSLLDPHCWIVDQARGEAVPSPSLIHRGRLAQNKVWPLVPHCWGVLHNDMITFVCLLPSYLDFGSRANHSVCTNEKIMQLVYYVCGASNCLMNSAAIKLVSPFWTLVSIMLRLQLLTLRMPSLPCPLWNGCV